MQMIDELKRSVTVGSYDSMPYVGSSKEDLNLDDIRDDFERTKRLTDKGLQTLKLLVNYQGNLVPSDGAMILYGSNRINHFLELLRVSCYLSRNMPVRVLIPLKFVGKISGAYR